MIQRHQRAHIAYDIIRLQAGADIEVCQTVTVSRRGEDATVTVVAIHTPDGTEIIDDRGRHHRTIK